MASDPTAERLRGHLSEYGRRNPGAWSLLEHVHLHREGLPQWPEWCYVPIAAAVSNPDVVRPQDAAIVTALAAWRLGQGVYRFDPDVLSAVWDTPVTGDIPSEVLFRLPEWAVYIEAPPTSRWRGAYAHLEWDPAPVSRAELRLVFDGGQYLVPPAVHLGGTLEEGLTRMVREAERQAAEHGMSDLAAQGAGFGELRAMAEPVISCLIYLCSQAADYSGDREPQRAAPKRVKGGLRLFPAPGPVVWEVGVRMGAALRAAYQRQEQEGGEGTGRTVRPHVRRAHWHGFWRGPRDGQRQLIVKWLPPIPVAFEDGQERPVVIHPVGG